MFFIFYYEITAYNETRGDLCLLSPSITKNNGDRFQNDLEIQPQRPIIDVRAVQANYFFEIGDVGSSADLPKTGESGHQGKTALVVVVVLLVFCNGGRTGANKRHIAQQNVPELGKFVNGCAADELAYLGDAGIILHLEHMSAHLILFHQFLQPNFRISIHRA